MAARRRLCRWGSWFALANAGLLVLVGLRYLWYYAWLRPSVAWIYAGLALMGQMSVFACVPFLFLVLVIVLVPWPRVVVPIAVLLWSAVLSLLLLDSLLFADNRYQDYLYLHGLSVEIARYLGSSGTIAPTTSDKIQRPAPRPKYSVLSGARFRALTGESLGPWEEAVHHYLASRKAIAGEPA